MSMFSIGVRKYSFSTGFRSLGVVLHMFSRIFLVLAGLGWLSWLAGLGCAGWLAELGGWPGLAELGSSGIVLHAFSRVFVAQAHKTRVFSCFHSSGIVLHMFSCVFVAQASYYTRFLVFS